MSVQAEQVPCWSVTCDQCGEGDADGGAFHYGSRVEAVEAVQGAEWVVTDSGAAFCRSCWEEGCETVPCSACGAQVEHPCHEAHEGVLRLPCGSRVEAWAAARREAPDA